MQNDQNTELFRERELRFTIKIGGSLEITMRGDSIASIANRAMSAYFGAIQNIDPDGEGFVVGFIGFTYWHLNTDISSLTIEEQINPGTEILLNPDKLESTLKELIISFAKRLEMNGITLHGVDFSLEAGE